jgi:hypothetical protein
VSLASLRLFRTRLQRPSATRPSLLSPGLIYMSHCSSWSLLALAALCCSLRPSSVLLHAGRRTAAPPRHNLVHVLPTDPLDLVLKLKPARVFAARRRRALSHRSTCTPATGLSTVCTSKQRGYRPARVPLQHAIDAFARTRGWPVDLVLQRRLHRDLLRLGERLQPGGGVLACLSLPTAWRTKGTAARRR